MRTPLLFASLVVVVNVAHANAPDGRPVLNSFVDRRVSGVSDLVAHVRTDSVVMDRYVRHFSMTRPEVLRYLGALHLGRLPKAGTYTIYSVPQGGRLKMHVGRIRKGEPMFFDRQGRPTLVLKCGNPVTLGPNRPHAAASRLGLSTPEGERAMELPEGRLTDPLAMDPSPLEPEVLDPTVLTATAVAVPTGVESIPTVAASALGSGFSWLGGIGILSIPGASIIKMPQGPFTPKQPVPEPGMVVALAVGLVAAARRRSKK